MHVSVVIPTFNRAALLGQTIPALMQQETSDFTYEVIFVINGSSDNSEAMLRQAAEENPGRLRYFYISPTGGPSAPRNVGIRAAYGDVVIILDDDVLPDSSLVLRHAEFHLQHPEVHHAALGELYVDPALMHDPMSMFHEFPYAEVRGKNDIDYLHFWTCNVSFKKQFMLDHGMFDERFLAYEDIICGYHLANHGMHLHFVPEARGKHMHQMKTTGLPDKGTWYGRWLYALENYLPERAVKVRFGILSTDLGPLLYTKRLVRRIGLRVVDNVAIMAALRAMGANGPRRTRVTDFYNRLIFRHYELAGYYEAKRDSLMGEALLGKAAAWTNRGE